MTEKELSELTDKELLQEAKRMKLEIEDGRSYSK